MTFVILKNFGLKNFGHKLFISLPSDIKRRFATHFLAINFISAVKNDPELKLVFILVRVDGLLFQMVSVYNTI